MITTAAVCVAFFSLVATHPGMTEDEHATGRFGRASILDSVTDRVATIEGAIAVIDRLDGDTVTVFMEGAAGTCVDFAVDILERSASEEAI